MLHRFISRESNGKKHNKKYKFSDVVFFFGIFTIQTNCEYNFQSANSQNNQFGEARANQHCFVRLRLCAKQIKMREHTNKWHTKIE